MFSLSPRHQHPRYTWQRHTHPEQALGRTSKLLLTVMCHLNKAGTKNPSWHRKLCPVLSQLRWRLMGTEGGSGRPQTDLIARLPKTSLARWLERSLLYLVFIWEDGWEEVALRLARGVWFGLHHGGLHFFMEKPMYGTEVKRKAKWENLLRSIGFPQRISECLH